MKYVILVVLIVGILLFLTWNDNHARQHSPPEVEQRPPQTIVVVKELQLPPEVPEVPARVLQPKSLADAPVESGRLIAMQADYRRNLGFPAYVEAMKRRRARFFIFDAGKDKLVAEVELPGGALSRIDPASLAGLSPRVREISGEIAVSAVIEKAKHQFGQGYHKVIMLLPLAIEKRLDRSIRERLVAAGQDPDEVNQIEGEYMNRTGQLCFGSQFYHTDAGKHRWATVIPF